MIRIRFLVAAALLALAFAATAGADETYDCGGACGAPGSHVDWCDGQVPGAAFTDAWATFRSWGG